MTPTDMYAMYTRLAVPLPFQPSAVVTVRIHNYQNYAPSTGAKPANYTATTEKMKGDVDRKWNESRLAEGESLGSRGLTVPAGFKRESIMYVFSGKGSPVEIRTVLQLVAEYGLGDYSSYEHDPGSKLQAYCENYIGLDCNGFAGNFARLTGSSLGPNSPVSAFSDSTTIHRRKKRDQIQPGDAIVEEPKGANWPHVALVESGLDNGGIPVVEAAGDGAADGLYRSKYAISGDADGRRLFQIQPPYKVEPIWAYIVGPLTHVGGGKP